MKAVAFFATVFLITFVFFTTAFFAFLTTFFAFGFTAFSISSAFCFVYFDTSSRYFSTSFANAPPSFFASSAIPLNLVLAALDFDPYRL